MTTRRLDVGRERLVRWVSEFARRHGGIRGVELDAGVRPVVLEAGDGSSAAFAAWPEAPPDLAADRTPEQIGTVLTGWGLGPPVVGLVLVRRGGYAVGLARNGTLARHHCGTRYVQGRTAAGGWSQQRFARRRDNQADVLVGAAADQVARVVGEEPGGWVLGGDRQLVTRLLQRPGAPVDEESRPRREFWDIPDPRLTVLTRVLERSQAMEVVLDQRD